MTCGTGWRGWSIRMPTPPEPSKGATRFIVRPRRWAVERSLGWIMRACRLVRDYERRPHSEALITWAVIILMTPA